MTCSPAAGSDVGTPLTCASLFQSASVEEALDEKRSRLEEATATSSPGLLYPGGFLDPAILYRYYGWPYVAASLPRLVPAVSSAQAQAAPAHSKDPHTQT